MPTLTLELEKLNTTLMEKKSGLLSSQDQNNAPIRVSREASVKVSISETERYTRRLNPNGEVRFGGLKNPEPSLGGNLVFIHIYFLHCINIFIS
jgi:hypothetical protein